MEFVPEDKILKIRPDTKKYIRQMYGFDKPESLEEAIRILQEWIEKQPHFNKKDFGDRYLEATIILNKGSIERAKLQLDKYCTMRTFMPQFFGKYNCKTDFEHLHQVTHSVLLPKLTEDHYRICVSKFFDVGWESSQALLYFRHSLIMAEYGKIRDYVCGMALVLDFSEASVISVLAKLSPILTKQAMTVLIEGYGMRIKRIHVISDSKFVDGFVSLLKQVVSAKIASRINVHKSVEELHGFYPKDILPKDYGGEERSLKTLNGDRYLEATLIVSKGSIERSKSLLDKICTMRTLMPQFFGKYNCKTDFEHLHRVIHTVLLPKLTEDHYRIHITKFFDLDSWEPSRVLHFFRHGIIIAEYDKAHDYVYGFVMVFDFSEASVMSFLTKTSPILAKQAMTVLIEGYGMRVKRIHVISDSKFVDGFVSLMKQVVSAKIASRINVHKSVEELHGFYPKDILPKDYGGEERSLKTLNGEWLDVLSSEEHMNYLEGMNKATTNESCRPKEQFHELYTGMPGTFRFLSVD